jgi:hypothetical protein
MGMVATKGYMSLLRIIIVLPLLAAPGWAEGCTTPENFAALVGVILDQGQPTEYGVSVADDQRADKHYASFVPPDLLVSAATPELHMSQETWTRQGRVDHIDQWIIKFTLNGTFVLHRELAELDKQLLHETQLPTEGVDQVTCNIFRAFLGDLPTSRRD